MAKLDKETMKKQHFWLLLIPVLIGLLIAWLGLFVNVSDATAEKADENEKQKKAVEAAKAQSKATLALYDKQKEELFNLRTQRWEEMWNLQKAIIEWPEALGEDQIAKVKDQKFGAEISDSPFLNTYRDHAMKGYDQVAGEIAPMQFAGDWRTVLRNVPAWKRNPVSEDVWLAAEDYWVQRELLKALAGVNKDAAQFKRTSELPANDPRRALKDTPNERSFVSRTWQVDLTLTNKPTGPIVEGYLTNLTGRLQPFNANNELLLNVYLSSEEGVKPFPFAIEGTTIEGGKKEKIKFVERKHTVLEGRALELFKVEQVFDVRTAPVKRLDKMALGQVSARHLDVDLQMAAFSTKAVEAETMGMGMEMGMGMGGTGPPTGSSLSGPPTGSSLSGPPGGMGGGFGAPAAASTDATFNGLPRKRYVSRTDQVRALPVGLVVIVDQAFVQDVLTAVTNCKLRFQTLQTTLSRFHGSLSYAQAPPSGFGPGPGPAAPPRGEGGERGPPGPMRPPLPGMPPGGPPGGLPPSGPPGGFGSSGFFGGSAPQSSSDDQTAGSLVEVSVYGIATLYEKFEKAPKKDDATAETGTGTGTGTTGTTTAPGKRPEMPPGKTPEMPPAKTTDTPPVGKDPAGTPPATTTPGTTPTDPPKK